MGPDGGRGRDTEFHVTLDGIAKGGCMIFNERLRLGPCCVYTHVSVVVTVMVVVVDEEIKIRKNPGGDDVDWSLTAAPFGPRKGHLQSPLPLDIALEILLASRSTLSTTSQSSSPLPLPRSPSFHIDTLHSAPCARRVCLPRWDRDPLSDRSSHRPRNCPSAPHLVCSRCTLPSNGSLQTTFDLSCVNTPHLISHPDNGPAVILICPSRLDWPFRPCSDSESSLVRSSCTTRSPTRSDTRIGSLLTR